MSATYKKDNRTRFWVAIYDDQFGGRTVYVADCLKEWFSLRFPLLMQCSRAGWEESSKGKAYLYIGSDRLNQIDWDNLNGALSFAGSNCFWPKIPGTEIGDKSLSYCVVGDYTQCPDDQNRQTSLGRAFHAAKYESLDLNAANQYMTILTQSIYRMMSIFEGCYDPKRAVVMHIPVARACKDANLGYQIALQVAQMANLPFMEVILDCNKPQFKGLRLDEKLVAWEEIYDKRMSAVQFPINSPDVFIVDDLYQSGTTMWAFARYLKNLGARQVFGLACVKSLRDSDNVGGWV